MISNRSWKGGGGVVLLLHDWPFSWCLNCDGGGGGEAIRHVPGNPDEMLPIDLLLRTT